MKPLIIILSILFTSCAYNLATSEVIIIDKTKSYIEPEKYTLNNKEISIFESYNTYSIKYDNISFTIPKNKYSEQFNTFKMKLQDYEITVIEQGKRVQIYVRSE